MPQPRAAGQNHGAGPNAKANLPRVFPAAKALTSSTGRLATPAANRPPKAAKTGTAMNRGMPSEVMTSNKERHARRAPSGWSQSIQWPQSLPAATRGRILKGRSSTPVFTPAAAEHARGLTATRGRSRGKGNRAAGTQRAALRGVCWWGIGLACGACQPHFPSAPFQRFWFHGRPRLRPRFDCRAGVLHAWLNPPDAPVRMAGCGPKGCLNNYRLPSRELLSPAAAFTRV